MVAVWLLCVWCCVRVCEGVVSTWLTCALASIHYLTYAAGHMFVDNDYVVSVVDSVRSYVSGCRTAFPYCAADASSGWVLDDSDGVAVSLPDDGVRPDRYDSDYLIRGF